MVLTGNGDAGCELRDEWVYRMRLSGLLLAAGLVGVGAQLGSQAPANALSTPKRALARANEAHGKPANNKPTLANPDQNKQAAPAKSESSPAKTVSHNYATAEDICRAIEVAAAENDLPVNFFVRVIWQESRFDTRAVSHKGAEGIAQFMPKTADFRGLANPFDPISSIENAARYLADLRNTFGNLGLAAAGYNAGPGRLREWLDGKARLPKETRNYVALITGWSADGWASPAPPSVMEPTLPYGVPCANVARLVLTPPPRGMAACVPHWDAKLIAAWSKARARRPQAQPATLIGDRDAIVLRNRFANLGLGEACYTVNFSRMRGRLAAAKEERRTVVVAHVPLWGAQLTANWSEADAWATYRKLQKRFAALIGGREPIVLRSSFPGMGAVPRYMIRIADDDREDLEKLCKELIAAGSACAVLRNERSPSFSPPPEKGSG